MIVAAIALILALAGPAMAQSVTELWRLGGFSTPESVLFDAANNRLIVSNLGTGLGGKGGPDGYLSLLSTDGTMLTEKWVPGLVDPKGMAILGDSLFVADIGGLVQLRLADGVITANHIFEQAILLDDVASDGSALYISDMFGSAIYRFADGQGERWLADQTLMSPNGLYVDGGTLYIGGFGIGLTRNLRVAMKGGLIAVDLASKAITPVEGTIGLSMTNGVARLGNGILFNDSPSGRIYAYLDGRPAEIASPGRLAGDFAGNGNVLYVPLLRSGEIVALRID